MKGNIEGSQDNFKELFKLVIATRDSWVSVEKYCVGRQAQTHEERKVAWSPYLKDAKENISSWEYAIAQLTQEAEDLIDYPFATLVWKGSIQEESGEIKEVRILKTMLTYPFIRIEEVGGEKFDFGAAHLELTVTNSSHLEAIINCCNELGKQVSFVRENNGEDRLSGLFHFPRDFCTLEFPPLWLKEVLDGYSCHYEPNYLFTLD